MEEHVERPEAEASESGKTDQDPDAPGVTDAEPALDPEEEAKKLAELRPGEGVVAGKVLVKGVPVPPGVEVRLAGGEGGPLVSQTDRKGDFRFEGVEPGDYELVVEHGDYAPKRVEFSMQGEHGAGPFDLSLKHPAPPAGVVVGKVSRAAGGELLPDAWVALRIVDKSKGFVRYVDVHKVATDARGEFRFEKLSLGRYQMRVTHPELAMRRINFDLPETEGAGPFDIQLTTGGTLRVRVVGAWETPVADQQISLKAGDSRTGIAKRTGRTDADGELLFEHLPPGPYWVHQLEIREDVVERKMPGGTARSVRKTEHGPLRTVTVHEAKTTDLVFEASCGVTGTVFGPNGKAMPRAIVRLTPAVRKVGEGYRTVQTHTDAEGRFEIQGFPPGEYEVSVQTLLSKKDYVVDVARLEFKQGEIRSEEIRIPDSRISGRILAGDTGKPFDRRQEGVSLPQAQARPVEVEDGKVVKWLGKNTMAFADADGRFKLVGLPPGTYWIWFPSPSPHYRDATRIVDFTAGGQLKGVNIRLEPRKIGTLRLMVLEPDGTPAAGVYFSVRSGPRSSRTLHGKQVEDGVWEFPLEVGPREVHVIRTGFEVETVKLAVPQGGLVERTVKLRVREKKD
ncbi:MAG: MSCRAMM family protein [Planctomycetota bacterium]